MAEGMAFEDLEKGGQDPSITIVSRNEPSIAEIPCPAVVEPSELKAKPPRSTGDYFKDWANTLFGSSLSNPQRKSTQTRRRSARRLGVCLTVTLRTSTTVC